MQRYNHTKGNSDGPCHWWRSSNPSSFHCLHLPSIVPATLSVNVLQTADEIPPQPPTLWYRSLHQLNNRWHLKGCSYTQLSPKPQSIHIDTKNIDSCFCNISWPALATTGRMYSSPYWDPNSQVTKNRALQVKRKYETPPAEIMETESDRSQKVFYHESCYGFCINIVTNTEFWQVSLRLWFSNP